MRGKAPPRSERAEATLITAALLRGWQLPSLDEDGGKEARGRVLVVGGSEQIPGAVLLAGTGALRAGAGKLQIATAANVAAALAVAIPEARVIALKQLASGELSPSSGSAIADEIGRCSTLLLGPGMMDPRAAITLFEQCIENGCDARIVLDAAALQALASGKPRRGHAGGIVITPHAGEMAQLRGLERERVVREPLRVARAAAAELGVVVALKGAHTYVAAPDGTAFHNTAGNIGLGTSGSGDTLSGIIAGLCARGADPLQAAVWGVYLHAKAGDALAARMGPLGFLARELLGEVPSLLGKLTR
ncbi:MAG TPA: NAD(P)H-hydrate dehydratase [Polyangiaceae bacterium]|nr:NAD(P)H-hydrate dehydratase [Polyangiaceae bacterium]